MIFAYGELHAVHTTSSMEGQYTNYMYHDALGSIDTIVGENGNVVERLAYDPFGERTSLTLLNSTSNSGYVSGYTNRGFTSHEHIEEYNLVHMNGRVYDPEIGRFLSADIVVSNINNSQTYNAYSYALNNPLKYRDPSGYFIPKNSEIDDIDRERNHYYNDGDHDRFTGDNNRQPINQEPVEETEVEAEVEAEVAATIPPETNWSLGWDGFQIGLTVMGQMPLLGIPVDLANATIYAVRGMPFEALGSVANALPIIGNTTASVFLIGKAAKVTKSADKLGDFAHNYQRSVGASQRVPKVLQTGGNKLNNRVAKGLNDHFGENYPKRDWGRALEGLKKDNGLRNDHHGRILDNGDYVNDAGDLLSNIGDYLP